MAIADVEATMHPDTVQERRTVGAMAMDGRLGKELSVDRVRVSTGNNVVEVEIPNMAPIDHKALGRPVDKAYEASRAMVMNRLSDIGVAHATIVNFLPIPLISCSTLEPLRKVRIPAVKDGQEYAFHVFKHAHLEPARMGQDAPLLAFDFHPIQLAKEFERVYAGEGAAFAFVGHPEDIKNPNWVHREEFERVKQRAIDYMHAMLKEAKSAWDKKLFFAVRDTHKACIRRLYSLGYIKTLPEHIDRQRDTAVAIPTCPKCQRPSEPNAVQCTNLNCNYIIYPRQAYEIHAIDEQHECLERLTRKEVEEMGISAYVAETIDEKPARIKAGLPKPASKAAMMVIEQNAELDEQDRKNHAKDIATGVAKAIKEAKPAKGDKAPAAESE